MMNRKVRLTRRTMVVGAASAVATAACGGPAAEGPNEDRPENEIHVLVVGDAAAEAEEAAAERFNATSDVKVIVDRGSTAGNEYSTSVRNAVGTPTAPDVFMSWGAANIKPLVDAGALLALDEFIDEDPALQESFLPSVFDEEVIDGETYGIPMRGVAPTFLFYNKQVLAAAGLEPARTWDDLLAQAAVLQNEGVTPIGLAGTDKWPTQMWFQYAFARMLGNERVAAGLAGDGDVWSSDESRQALALLAELVDAGAFGDDFGSVAYGSDGSAALLRTGKSAYELMGTWYYADVTAGDEQFAETTLGWIPFPSVDGGGGQAGEIAGTLSNYYNVAADTRYPDTVRGFLKELYGEAFLQDQLALGNLPPTADAADLVAQQTDLSETRKAYLAFVIGLVDQAPTFQLSWDQAVPAESLTTVQNAMADYFNGTVDAAGWITAMQGATSVA
jgi:xylobiose transport system substrate-binding protein